MLLTLSIENYTLIQKLDLRPSSHLNVITGETGAGKSILLGAVGLLLGNRADTKSLWDPSKKCIIEGTFDIKSYELRDFFEINDLDYESEIIIRREISVSGKSRAFVNDTPVLLDTLKELGRFLVDIHSQNDTLLLGNESFQLDIIDKFSETSLERKVFETSFLEYREADSKLKKLKSLESEMRKDADYNNFLLAEFEKIKLQNGQQELLEAELKELENAEEIKRQLNDALLALAKGDFASSSSVNTARLGIQQLAKISDRYTPFYERLDSVLIELNDIVSEIEHIEQDVEHLPGRIIEVQERLSMIYHLQKKHQVSSVDALLQIEKELVEKSEQVLNLDEELARAESALSICYKKTNELAGKLSAKRKSKSSKLGESIRKILVTLGIPNAKVIIEHMDSEMRVHGVDSFSILFSANKGVAPEPLKKVASGGEFSRLMFAVKFLLANKTSLPTLIFDEIEAGVSGEIALQLGALMKSMAQKHQVISISHLPQIAAKADQHFFVYKDHKHVKSVSQLKELSEEEHVEEVAKMISGDRVTDSALLSARELIAR